MTHSDKTTIENRMKYGYYEKINNTAYFYETAFNIAVIVAQI